MVKLYGNVRKSDLVVEFPIRIGMIFLYSSAGFPHISTERWNSTELCGNVRKSVEKKHFSTELYGNVRKSDLVVEFPIRIGMIFLYSSPGFPHISTERWNSTELNGNVRKSDLVEIWFELASQLYHTYSENVKNYCKKLSFELKYKNKRQSHA